jgi:hypothetical protein
VSAAARFSGIEARRSTRIERTVPMIIVGQTKLGLSFEERTAAVSLNLHGCRYPSRHDYSVGSWVGLQVLEPNGDGPAPIMRAQVRSIHPPMSPRELYQIGVELEAPSNVWGVPAPPDDWQRYLNGTGIKMQAVSASAPAPTPVREPIEAPSAATAETVKAQPPAGPEYRSTGVTAFPAPPPAVHKPEVAPQPAPRPERVVITSDQLVAAVHGKLQQAAEKAVHSAINSHLMDAVRQALSKIDDVRHASVHQMEQYSAQHLEGMMRSAREEVLSRMDARLTEDRRQWDEQQEAYRARAEEIAKNLETLAATVQHNLSESQKFFEKIGGEVEPTVRTRLAEAITRATDDFDSAATRVSDRQLVRLMEDKQMVTREAAAQLDAHSAEARAQLQSAASDIMAEFKRQMEVQMDLSISDAMQRVMSSLDALDAENRAACEARRRNIESDVAHATQQSTEEFRSGMKAFLYSCLVAAVGAVDQHAQTTLNGMKDPTQALRDMANTMPAAPNGDAQMTETSSAETNGHVNAQAHGS